MLLTEVVGDCSFKVQNQLDLQYKPRTVNEMISSAEELIGKEMEYCVLSTNHELSVTDLRYGQAQSRQVRPALGWALSLLEVCLGWR